MPEAINVPVGGFNVPPVPPSATQSGNTNTPAPPPSQMTPGFVVPDQGKPVQGMTPEQVQAEIQKALAAAAAKAPPVEPVVQPAAVEAGVDDPVLTSLTDVFLNVGGSIDMERALGNALTYGDANLIDFAYINENGGANAAQLATVAKAIVERVQTQATEATQAVYSTAGDKAQWDAAAAVFNTSAPQHLKLVIAQMLDSGNNDAIKAAAKSVVDYVKNNGLVVNPAKTVQAGAANLGAAQALGKAEFQEALFKLDPNTRSYMQERNALFARRQLGKSLGRN